MRVVRSRAAGAGPRSRAGFPSGPGRLPSEGGGHLPVHPALFRLSSAVPRPAVGSGTRVSAVQPFQPYVPPRRGASTSLPPSLAGKAATTAAAHHASPRSSRAVGGGGGGGGVSPRVQTVGLNWGAVRAPKRRAGVSFTSGSAGARARHGRGRPFVLPGSHAPPAVHPMLLGKAAGVRKGAGSHGSSSTAPRAVPIPSAVRSPAARTVAHAMARGTERVGSALAAASAPVAKSQAAAEASPPSQPSPVSTPVPAPAPSQVSATSSPPATSSVATATSASVGPAVRAASPQQAGEEPTAPHTARSTTPVASPATQLQESPQKVLVAAAMEQAAHAQPSGQRRGATHLRSAAQRLAAKHAISGKTAASLAARSAAATSGGPTDGAFSIKDALRVSKQAEAAAAAAAAIPTPTRPQPSRSSPSTAGVAAAGGTDKPCPFTTPTQAWGRRAALSTDADASAGSVHAARGAATRVPPLVTMCVEEACQRGRVRWLHAALARVEDGSAMFRAASKALPAILDSYRFCNSLRCVCMHACMHVCVCVCVCVSVAMPLGVYR